MNLALQASGLRFDVYFVEFSDDAAVSDCPVKEFLESLPPASLKSMAARLKEHRDHGPIQDDDTKSRTIRDGIFELKNRQDARLFCFYLPGRRTVVTEGAHKPKRNELNAYVDRAKEIKRQLEGRGQ